MSKSLLVLTSVLFAFSFAWSSYSEWYTVWGEIRNRKEMNLAECYRGNSLCETDFLNNISSFLSPQSQPRVCDYLTPSISNKDIPELTNSAYQMDIKTCDDNDKTKDAKGLFFGTTKVCETDFLRFQYTLGIPSDKIKGEDKAAAVLDIYTSHLRTPYEKADGGDMNYWEYENSGKIPLNQETDFKHVVGRKGEKEPNKTLNPMSFDKTYVTKKCYNTEKFGFKRLVCNTFGYKIYPIGTEANRAYAVVSTLLDLKGRETAEQQKKFFRDGNYKEFGVKESDLQNSFAGGTSITVIRESDGKVIVHELARSHVTSPQINRDLEDGKTRGEIEKLVGSDFDHLKGWLTHHLKLDKNDKDFDLLTKCQSGGTTQQARRANPYGER